MRTWVGITDDSKVGVLEVTAPAEEWRVDLLPVIIETVNSLLAPGSQVTLVSTAEYITLQTKYERLHAKATGAVGVGGKRNPLVK